MKTPESMDQSKSKQVDNDAYEFSSDESKRAAQKAMALLLFQDRTRKELQDRLYRAGFSESDTMEAMEYVSSFGYINDVRYAENYIEFQKHKRSRKDIIYRLVDKGISKDIVLQVFEEAEYEGEQEAVRELMLKKLKGRNCSEISYEEKNKIFGYLGRKGYEFSTIKNVFSQLDNYNENV